MSDIAVPTTLQRVRAALSSAGSTAADILNPSTLPVAPDSLEIRSSVGRLRSFFLLQCLMHLSVMSAHLGVSAFVIFSDTPYDTDIVQWLIASGVIAAVRLVPAFYLFLRFQSWLFSSPSGADRACAAILKSIPWKTDAILRITNFSSNLYGFVMTYQASVVTLPRDLMGLLLMTQIVGPAVFGHYITLAVLASLAFTGISFTLSFLSFMSLLYAFFLPLDEYKRIFYVPPSQLQPLPKRILKKLPVITWPPDHATNGAACSICLNSYSKGQRIRVLWCDHIFHHGCVDQWLRRHSSCPLRCKMNPFIEDPEKSSEA